MAESKLHKELKYKAHQYLLNQSYRLARFEKECGYMIADAWGIDYQTLYTKIIEVKISRADFHSDKYKKYQIINTPTAEEIYYLCPSGLIQPEEVGECCGLLWYNEKTGRLLNKKKAPILKVHIRTKLRILIDFLEANTPFERKMTLLK